MCAPKSTHGGCFWKPIFKAIAQLIPALIKIAVVTLATFACGTCAILISGVVSSVMVAVTGGNLSQALRAGFIAMATAAAFNFVGDATAMPGTGSHDLPFGSEQYVQNVAGHAAVGCLTAVASGGKCGAGAASAALGAAGAPFLQGQGLVAGTAASAVLGGLGSVAAGGKFADGAVTAAFGYLFNACAARGCWVTNQERALANDGDYGGYYKLACSGGDGYACRAGEVAAGHADGFIRDNLAVATNLDLFNNITNGNGISLDDAAFPKILEGIRTGLAKAYVNYLDGQAATESDPFVPSRKDIGSFHIDIFRQYNAGTYFGGKTMDFYTGWMPGYRTYVFDWCPGCRK